MGNKRKSIWENWKKKMINEQKTVKKREWKRILEGKEKCTENDLRKQWWRNEINLTEYDKLEKNEKKKKERKLRRKRSESWKENQQENNERKRKKNVEKNEQGTCEENY